MKKNAQITLFVILGIIIVSVFIGIIVAKTFIFREQLPQAKVSQTASIIEYVNHCLEDVSKEGLFLVGTQGGYYKQFPSKTIQFFSFTTPIYFSSSSSKIPTLNSITEQISQYTQEHLENCLKNFQIFSSYGLVIQPQKEPSVAVKVGSSQLTSFLKYPLIISLGKENITVDSFSITLDVDLKDIFNKIEKTFPLHTPLPKMMPLGKLMDLATKNNYQFEIDNLEDNIILYIFLFETKEDKEKPFIFSYAVQYDWKTEDFAP